LGSSPRFKLAVEGFVDESKKFKVFHTFTKTKRHIVGGGAPGGSGMLDMVYEMTGCGSGAPATKKQDLVGAGERYGDSSTNPKRSSAKTPKLINPNPLNKMRKDISPSIPSTTLSQHHFPGGLASLAVLLS